MGGDDGLSLSAYVRRSSSGGGGSGGGSGGYRMRLLDFADASGGNNIVVSFDDGVFSYEVWGEGSLLGSLSVTNHAFPLDTWVRVGLLHRPNGKATIYWDGVSKAQANKALPPRLERTSNWIGLGHRSDDTCFEGAVSQVMVYAVALSKSELELYEDGSVPYGGAHLAVNEGLVQGPGCPA